MFTAPRSDHQAVCDPSNFCGEFSVGLPTEYAATYPDGPSSRVLAESDNYVVVPDLSPLLTGHCLLVPKRHALNFADIVRSDPRGLFDFARPFISRYLRRYKTYTVLEHGSAATTNASACIVHAHLHVVPLDATLIMDEMIADGLDLIRVAAVHEIPEFADWTAPYFLIGGRSHGFWIAPDDLARKKQYLRVVVGRLLGYDEAECDWAVAVRRPLFFETLSDLCSSKEGHHPE